MDSNDNTRDLLTPYSVRANRGAAAVRPLKLLTVTTSYPQHDGFMPGIFVQKLCEALVHHGVDVTALSPSDAAFAADYDTRSPVRTLRVRYFFRSGEVFFNRPPGGLPQRFRKFSWAWFLAPLAVAILLWKVFWAARRADVIHCHWFPTALFAWLPSRIWRKPLVITVHGSDAYFLAGTRWGRAVMRLVFRQAARIISVNQSFVEWLRENLPEFVAKTEFLPNGVSIRTANEPARTPTPEFRLVFIGNVVPAKGIAELRSAVDRMIAEGVDLRLTIIGACSEAQQPWLTAWLQEQPDHVRHLGMIPQERVLEELVRHDLLVLPTYREGRCSVIMEAMAANLPILTTSIPTMCEMLEHGREAILVEPENTEAFYQGLRWCLEHRAELPILAQAASERFAREGQTWDACAARHVKIYQQVLQDTPRPHAADSSVECQTPHSRAA